MQGAAASMWHNNAGEDWNQDDDKRDNSAILFTDARQGQDSRLAGLFGIFTNQD